MRFLRHPGPPAALRQNVVPCRAHPLVLDLKAGESVNAAVTGALARAGFASGFARLDGVAVEPMRYVIPAAAPDDSHVAWYSATHAPEGVVSIEKAGVIAGIRDDAPFIHCHGVWRGRDGARRAGHLLPHESFVARDARVTAWGIAGAAFIARDDAETNFKLFAAEPVSGGEGEGGLPALACTVRPNGDISLILETACRDNGLAEADIHGIGSLAGVDFTDDRHVPSHATEVMIDGGQMRTAECQLDVALADMDGAVHEGRLARGENPVCVTFEVLAVARQG
ncbi:MAG: DUF296 domain-containing protein [Aquamicrobium sp.]|uniref:DUF296 domain-containing protein n=1 Tax=Aquamicrobium sp. TaxID=1872579 RepID=UPI00349ED658|nr:DUF296 domain-containing protein [Aquamicrobium sp.]